MQLGFLQKFESSQWLECRFFPSKVGGKPVWINPEFVPCELELTCKNCHGQLLFILQFYAPLKINPDSWHRTLYLFCCPNASCTQMHPECSYLVLRSQLPFSNPYYIESSDYHDMYTPEDENHPKVRYRMSHAAVCCPICGKRVAPTHCDSDSHSYHFCTRGDGQWHSGCGPKTPSVNNTSVGHNAPCCSLWVLPELEIVTESEDDLKALNLKRHEEIQRDMIQKHVSERADETDSDFDESDFPESRVDPILLKFQTVISYDSQQVLRYMDDSSKGPLWMHSKGMLEPGNVPRCELCGGDRVFEMQVLSQLIYCLQVENEDPKKTYLDKMDWGTLVIYTCKNSCEIPVCDKLGKYATEYLHQQLPVEMFERR